MKKNHLIIAALLSGALLPQMAHAQIIRKAAPLAATMSDADLKALGEGIAFPYEQLDGAIHDNVDKQGAVYYGKLKGDNQLATFVRAVAIADLSKFPQWTIPADPKDPKSKDSVDNTPILAFYINAYNGLFLKAISDAYPVNSPLSIKGLDTDKTRVVAGENYSFADLRRKIATLDPRALFALPDGTQSGPRASNSVFRYTGLNEQLNAAVTNFVNDITRVKPPVRLQNMVEVSPWLSSVDAWFSPQATRKKWNGIRTVLAGYTTRNSDQNYFTAGDYQVTFSLGNAALNEQISRGN